MSTSYTGNNAGPIVITFTIPADGDNVAAVSVNTVFEPEADNWAYAKRSLLDVNAGGTYSFASSITLGNVFTFDRSGVSDTSVAVTARGGGSGGLGGDFYGGGAAANGLRGTAAPAGVGVAGLGGTTSGAGGTFAAQGGNSQGVTGTGHGTGPGGEFFPGATADTPAVMLSGGGIAITSYAPAETDSVARDTFGPGNFAKCHGRMTTDGTGGSGTVGQGINILTFSISGKFLQVLFATDMANAEFTVVGTFQTTSGSPNFVTTGAWPLVRSGTGLGVTGVLLGAWSGSSQVDLSATAGELDFVVYERQ